MSTQDTPVTLSATNNIDNINRYALQASSVLLAVAENENLRALSHETITSVMWIVRDRIEEMEAQANELWKAYQTLNKDDIK